jgi:hypothetical protein
MVKVSMDMINVHRNTVHFLQDIVDLFVDFVNVARHMSGKTL